MNTAIPWVLPCGVRAQVAVSRIAAGSGSVGVALPARAVTHGGGYGPRTTSGSVRLCIRLSIANLSAHSRAVPWAGVNPARPAKALVRMAPPERHSQYATPKSWVHKLLNFFVCFFATPFCDTSDDRVGAADAGAGGRWGWGWGRG